MPSQKVALIKSNEMQLVSGLGLCWEKEFVLDLSAGLHNMMGSGKMV